MTDGFPARARRLRSLVTGEQTVRISVDEVAVDGPAADEVLIAVEAAPLNPSDLGLLLAGADVSRAAREAGEAVTAPLPGPAARAAAARTGQSLPVGNEGAGTVVAAGTGAEALLGKVVAAAGGGMYAEYRCVPAAACLVLPDGVPAEQGAASFVNPMTVLGIVETMRAEGHNALVHTAAASNLGQMLNRLCIEEDIPLVNIVRSPAQAQLLSDAGAGFVCDSSQPGFMDDLTAAIAQTHATVAFDAVGGGQLASQILTCMELALSAGTPFSRYGSATHKQVYMYGGLDRTSTTLSRGYGMAWGVGGWLLTPFLQRAGREVTARMRQRVADGITTIFASHFTDRLSLTEALDVETMRDYARMATGRKYLIAPHK